MTGKKFLLMFMASVVVLGLASCTSDTLDDGDGADVLLQMNSLTDAPVTASESQSQAGFCSVTTTTPCVLDSQCPGTETCIPLQGCELEVQAWNASMSNVPKNAVAASPFSDIVLETVTISYSWPVVGAQPPINTPTRMVGFGDIVVPVGGNNSIRFEPIDFNDLDTAMSGRTADLTLTFRGSTVEGTAISLRVVNELFVESCPTGP